MFKVIDALNHTIDTSKFNKALESGNFEVEYEYLESISAATGLTGALFNSGLIEPDDVVGFKALRTFSIVMPSFESWMGIVYPEMSVKFEAGHPVAIFKEFTNLRTKVRDYRG